jgi:2-iminobutanoate/2-iminopropanoate deaminase
MTTMDRTFLNPSNVPTPMGPYSQGIKASFQEAIFVSGQVAEDEKGQLVGKDDPEQQARRAFLNLASVLKEAGTTLDHVVKLTIILTSRDFYPAVSKVRKELFKQDFPTATSFIVSGLAKPDWLLEIEAIAIL